MTLSLVILIAATLALCIPGPLEHWPFVALALVTLILVTLLLVTLALVTLALVTLAGPQTPQPNREYIIPVGHFL